MNVISVPTVSHPTDRPNFCHVDLGEITIYFSYETPIAFWSNQTGQVVRKNDWGPTTGKHLCYVDNGNREARIEGVDFEHKLAMVLNAGEYVIEELPA